MMIATARVPQLAFSAVDTAGMVVADIKTPSSARSLGARQRAAFFTSAAIFASSAAVNFVSAYEVGHMLPSSKLALSLKPNVAYLALNLAASWKKRTALPFLENAGIPYHVVG